MSDRHEFFLLRWLSYPRAVLADVFILLYTPLHASIMIIMGLLTQSVGLGTFFLRTWSRLVLGACGVRVKVEGLENLPEGGAVYIFNHTSHFDIPVIHTALNKDLRFGAKIELFQIPFFGGAMRAVGVLPITRSSREEVLKIYERSIERVNQGEGFVLAPEGTRQNGKELGRFKAGPFVFAINAQCPMVPVVLHDVTKVLPKKKLLPNWGQWRSEVRVQVLPIIPTAGLLMDQRRDLQEQAWQVMDAAYKGQPVSGLQEAIAASGPRPKPSKLI